MVNKIGKAALIMSAMLLASNNAHANRENKMKLPKKDICKVLKNKIHNERKLLETANKSFNKINVRSQMLNEMTACMEDPLLKDGKLMPYEIQWILSEAIKIKTKIDSEINEKLYNLLKNENIVKAIINEIKEEKKMGVWDTYKDKWVKVDETLDKNKKKILFKKTSEIIKVAINTKSDILIDYFSKFIFNKDTKSIEDAINDDRVPKGEKIKFLLTLKEIYPKIEIYGKEINQFLYSYIKEAYILPFKDNTVKTNEDNNILKSIIEKIKKAISEEEKKELLKEAFIKTPEIREMIVTKFVLDDKYNANMKKSDRIKKFLINILGGDSSDEEIMKATIDYLKIINKKYYGYGGELFESGFQLSGKRKELYYKAAREFMVWLMENEPSKVEYYLNGVGELGKMPFDSSVYKRLHEILMKNISSREINKDIIKIILKMEKDIALYTENEKIGKRMLDDIVFIIKRLQNRLQEEKKYYNYDTWDIKRTKDLINEAMKALSEINRENTNNLLIGQYGERAYKVLANQ